MKLYQAYTSLPNNYSDWDNFISELPDLILEDSTLKELFSKYSINSGVLNQIRNILADQTNEELEFFGLSYFKEVHSSKALCEYLYNIANTSLKETLAPFILEPIKTDEEIEFLQSKTFDFYNEYRFDDQNSEILKAIEIDIEAYNLSQFYFFERLKSWNSNPFTKATPRIKKIVLIKTVSYFDPTIYKLIQKNPELLKTLDWRLFEEMLADILTRFKYTVELTRATKDGGIDIIALKKDDDFGVHKYLLQAKRYNHSVQVSPVRELLFLHDEYKATKSCLATTASFTRGAWELAENHKWKLELKDQNGILAWIDKILQSPLK